MSRIEEAFKIQRSIEKGEPQPTCSYKLANEQARQLEEQFKYIGQHNKDCSCYFCNPII